MPSHQKTLLCQYRYDPLDRLVYQSKQDSPAHQRFYCQNRLASEIQGAMRYSIIQHNDLLLAQLQHQGEVFESMLLASDVQRSVLQILKANHQRQSFAYSPYGHHPAENGLTSLLGFNGERPGPVTGHYLLGIGYRAFNPVLMRFHSPDSLSPFGQGGLNPYAYCLGDPVNQRDPTGRAISIHWAILRDNLKHIVSQHRPIPRTGTNGTMLLNAAPPLSRPTARVKPMQAPSPAPREPASANVMPPYQRAPNTRGNEYSRIIQATPHSSDALAQMTPAMRVAMRNAVESPRTAVVLPTPIEDAARLTEITDYTNMRGIGITGFPRATRLADQNRRAFDIRRRNDQRMEANPLRGNEAYHSPNE